ncbi:MAG: polysaccharide deacetylase family protein [Bacteroidales bacterium]|jgi:peptidoglycan/xylan/chitin deacetylase (PgdA/CDA1 family)|nr:polysaccharide deacetylase family protein [Bacteroidales bacterium]
MLKFYLTIILAILATIALIIADVSAIAFIALFIIVSVIIFLGVIKIEMQFFAKSLCRGDGTKQEVAITFDDGPHNNTLKILDILDKYSVKAAFFLIGKNADEKPDIVKEIINRGHIIGNHSYYHKGTFDIQSRKKMISELTKTNNTIKSITGKDNKLFRPPFGITNPIVGNAIKKMKLISIGWSVRSLDTSIKDPGKVCSRVYKRIKPGSVILLHDTTKDIDIILENIIKYLKNNNYKIVSLRDMFGTKFDI